MTVHFSEQSSTEERDFGNSFDEEVCALPTSFSQQRLWFFSQFEPGNPFYNIPAAVLLKGSLNVETLKRSFQEIVRRHEALRTTFGTVDGKPVQVIHPTLNFALPVTDLRELPPAKREAEVQKLTAEAALQHFNLAKVPLLRANLLHLDSEEYILLLTLHHIVFDGWSIGVLLRELAALYEAFSTGKPSPLAELPIQYADFAVWQREWLGGDRARIDLAYWKQQLEGAPPLLELPTDRPRPPVQTYRGAKHSFLLSKALTEALNSLSRKENVTLFMTLLAAFKTLLYRYTGQADIVVGAPIANRNRAEIQGLIGFFVNTLVLRTDLSDTPTFRELLARIREVTLEAYAHQELPLEQLMEELQPQRDLSYNPLFQVSLVLQNAPLPIQHLPGMTLTVLEVDNQTSKFDLTLNLEEKPDGISALFEYSTDLFDAATIGRMAGHFQTLLEEMSANPDRCIEELPLLTENERYQLLREWNDAPVDYPRDRCIHQLFEAQVDRTPDAVAVVFEDQKLTYRELNERANQLAHYLQHLGVKPEVLVGICVERSLDTIVGILGILKAGGAYVPLDPAYPHDRLAFTLEDAQISVLLTQQKLLKILPECSAKVIELDQWEEEQNFSEKSPSDFKFNQQNPSKLAYVIYTSGSTGRPKGVAIEHRSAVAFLHWGKEVFSPEELGGVLASTSICFDLSVFELFAPLSWGGTAILAENALHLPTLKTAEKVTLINTVPSAIAELLRIKGIPETVRTVNLAGEPLPNTLAQQLYQLPHIQKVFNLYGPSEDTTYSTFALIEKGAERMPPIGSPIANTQIYLLDRTLNPVPLGVPGELYIGGEGLARGYLNRPELTAQKFIPNPFSNSPDARLYKTGDLARYLPDGNIEYLGRIDSQVKIRGYRIELGEIEETLRQHSAVRDAVAIARDDGSGNKRLVAYVVQNADFKGTNETVAGSEWDAERISNWQSVFNDSYRQTPSDRDGIFNIVGWNSSYTDLPLSETEMREWLDLSIERILALQPQRVLEIGCGTGLLLFRIAPHCAQYWGADFSQIALDSIEQQLRSGEQNLPQVKLLHKEAQDFEGIEPESFDLVIINSVVQYFPSADYLLRVLSQAAKVVRKGGSIFIGDVRNLALLKAFHLSVQLHQASDDLPVAHLLQRVQKRIAQEQELILNPGFFSGFKRQFPNISSVQVQPKNGKFCNELTMFRYDVILRVGQETGQIYPPTINGWIDWQQQELTLKSAGQLLEETQPEALGFRHVPNARLNSEMKALELLKLDSAPQTAGQLKEVLQSLDPESGINPEALSELARELQYSVEISWLNGSPDGSYDAIFYKAIAPSFSQTSGFSRKALNAFANNPLQGKANRELVPQLRDYLHKKLPEYMVPAVFVTLESLPLTPNGKVDRKALPAPDRDRPELEEAFAAPSTAIEKILAEIWAQVLGLEQVGSDDNFFELGGDSILSIQVISKANQAGLRLTPKQLFQHQTIAQLAAVTDIVGTQQSEQGLIIGEVPLTPIQHWFFEQNLSDPHHWNQAVLLELRQPLEPALIESVLQELLKHHDALRLRFAGGESGWQQELANPDEVAPFTYIDLSSLPSEEREAAFQTAATQLQASLNLSEGPLLRAALFDLGKHQPNRLLLAIHHLAVDGVSWRILIEDFQTAYGQISRGETVALPPKTTSFKQWAERLHEWARSPELQREFDYWFALSHQPTSRLPVDFPNAANLVASEKTVSVALSVEETKLLLQEVPVAYRTQINDVLLTALGQTFERWTGNNSLLLDLEGHGREDLFEGVDLSRTIGWFTAVFPVLLNLEKPSDLGAVLKSVKEQLRAVPNRGVGCGVLGYLNPEIAKDLHKLPQSEVSFNYLGQFDQVLSKSSLLMLSSEPSGPIRSPRGNRRYLLEINGFIARSKLQLDWTYSENIHRRESIENLATGFIESLRSLIQYCQSPDAGGCTPSDFAEFKWSQWSQDDLDNITAILGEL
ncbi:amino acid adenylation domain-containing protein [Microcoleus sp. MOSTC5]|uniref:amino acid adenylation domain-containing protein n=1 Tax=Microcoleus sp. MOSTC5 TaxID=3055378 RepID=UPI002FD44FC2